MRGYVEAPSLPKGFIHHPPDVQLEALRIPTMTQGTRISHSEVLAQYRHALRPIRDRDLPSDWRCVDAHSCCHLHPPPLLRFGIHVPYTSETLRSRAQEAAKCLDDVTYVASDLGGHVGLVEQYASKLIDVAAIPRTTRSNGNLGGVLRKTGAWPPEKRGLYLFYELYTNDTGDKETQGRLTKADVTRLVAILEEVWGMRGQLRAMWCFDYARYHPAVQNYKNVDALLDSIGMPLYLRSRG
ncbi:hypothetical protein C8Q73DRAFT_363486 [Cubamyces lactineus]|nr:hypothetical protein C8Q73DRAFT_363486 [Cubamyces lactineus]